ncbi:hypothetical protein ESCO_000642 [Escovopsis weberi]|uniref:Uncharacterized protein n=1 Tax=Escovopsis weberi TaxID=150374 RepID=A0A0M9VU49_ESCWE|nr:hypothetical protein ESCO_000642 [Escovopsis weberi]
MPFIIVLLNLFSFFNLGLFLFAPFFAPFLSLFSLFLNVFLLGLDHFDCLLFSCLLFNFLLLNNYPPSFLLERVVHVIILVVVLVVVLVLLLVLLLLLLVLLLIFFFVFILILVIVFFIMLRSCVGIRIEWGRFSPPLEVILLKLFIVVLFEVVIVVLLVELLVLMPAPVRTLAVLPLRTPSVMVSFGFRASIVRTIDADLHVLTQLARLAGVMIPVIFTLDKAMVIVYGDWSVLVLMMWNGA